MARLGRRILSVLAAVAGFACPLRATAQQPTVPEVLRERTGPNAAPPASPNYLRPAANPSATPAQPTLSVAAGTVTLSDIYVHKEGGPPPRPRRGWRPESDPGTGLALSLRRGEAFDPSWVRRQFIENGLVGRPVALDRIVALTQLINFALAANGFVNSGLLVSGPPPSDGGVLALRLISGRLVPVGAAPRAVTVQWGPGGDRNLGEAYVRARMPTAQQAPFNAITLERQFRLLAEDPAVRNVLADLRPGARPGEASLLLTIDPQDRFDFYAGVANSRSPSIGGVRPFVGALMRNVIAGGDLLSAEAGVTSGRGDVVVGYETPVIDTRTRFSGRFAYNEAAVVDRPLLPLDIQSTDWTVDGGLTRRLVDEPLTPADEPGRWRAAWSLAMGFRLAHRRTETTLLGEPFSFSPGSVGGVAEYSVLRLTGDWTQRGIDMVVALSLTLTQGLGGTGSDVPGVAAPEEDFRVALAQFSVARRLGDRFELRARLTGQLADGLLYSGERLAAGGEYTVRGYRETLVLADSGVVGSVELAHRFSLTGRRNSRGVDWGAFSISGFVEGAVLRNEVDPQPVPDWIASAGAGLTWAPSEAIFARISYARALDEAPFVGSRDIQDRGFHFRLVVRPLALLRR